MSKGIGENPNHPIKIQFGSSIMIFRDYNATKFEINDTILGKQAASLKTFQSP
jgi:hypothetical protein